MPLVDLFNSFIHISCSTRSTFISTTTTTSTTSTITTIIATTTQMRAKIIPSKVLLHSLLLSTFYFIINSRSQRSEREFNGNDSPDHTHTQTHWIASQAYRDYLALELRRAAMNPMVLCWRSKFFSVSLATLTTTTTTTTTTIDQRQQHIKHKQRKREERWR